MHQYYPSLLLRQGLLMQTITSVVLFTFTWLLVHQDAKDGAKAKRIKDFLTWMISPEAQAMAAELHYAPLPKEVVALVASRLPTLKAGGKVVASN